MKKMLIGALALSLVAATAASAQPYSYGQYNQTRAQREGGERGRGDQQYQGRSVYGQNRQDHGRQGVDRGEHGGWGRDFGGNHHHWRRGERMGYNDWRNAQQVNYRRHHLRRPPQGYQWRESNGQYILGGIATGAILSIILNHR